MQYQAETVDDYIDQIPEERQGPVQKFREIFQKNLPAGFEEGILYKMIGFYVPHSLYPDGYHCNPKDPLPFVNIASQKNFIALYHSGIYAKKELYDWFVAEYPKHCKYKLDMGKSCVRFKKIDDIPYQLIEELAGKMTPQEWIEIYETAIKKK
ncbi:DUF1801 domain-containing protein [Marinirhabdus gelatinilytica]|uniref:Uncharacterized protein DUF1801 n=1 Tax=Marinirhabdus gelatinilytica TaxID=1703343 RepID=A0A370QJ19_9FLAO|nr:DUF1801 domain-containing protein [Marinirhabdus gelatinilytica]RDK88342.1 uncharacterized protein DUF1801 [Marinirhabdus gelatinilytica]